MLEIWGRRNSINVQKVMWAVGELKLKHVRHDAGMTFGIVGTDDYAAMNPNRRVPTLKDDDLIIWESNAIVRYLAAKYGDETFWPADPGRRALLDRWHDWTTANLMEDLRIVFWGLIRTKEADRDMGAIHASVERLGETMAILDGELKDKAFLDGDSLTFGDIVPGTAINRYFALPIKRPRLAHVEAWYERLKKRPAFDEHVMILLS